MYKEERYKSKKEADDRINELVYRLIRCHLYRSHREYVVQIWQNEVSK